MLISIKKCQKLRISKPNTCEKLPGLEPFDETRVSRSFEKLRAELLGRVRSLCHFMELLGGEPPDPRVESGEHKNRYKNTDRPC
jgi:hypothetical protein